MINQPNTSIASQYKSFSRTASVLTILVGSTVLLGWILDIPVLKSIFPGLATMKANTALAFIFSGLTLWLILREPDKLWTRYTIQIFSFFIALLGLLTLCEYIFGWQLGIDQWLFKDLGGGMGNLTPGRMSPTTALNFLLLGVAFLLLSRQTSLGIRTMQILGLLVILLSGLALLGYIYGTTALYGLGAYNQVAVHTALTFVVVSVGLLCTRPDSGPMGILTSGNAGSFTARRLLPMAIVIPIILGWLRLQGQRAGYYDTELGLAILVSSSIVVFVGLLAWNAVWLNRVDAELKREQASGLRQNEERLRYVTWATRDAVWDRDLVTGEVWWNEGLQKLFHYRADQVEPNVGWWEKHIHPEDRDKVVRSIQAILTTKQHLWSKEYRFEREDGSYANIFDRGYVLYDEQSRQPQRMIGAMADISEQKRIEQALRQSEELFAKAFSASPAGIILTRRGDGHMIEVNDAYLKIVGYTRKEVLGQTTLELGVINAEDRARLLQMFDEQGTVRDFEYWTRTKSGQLRAVLTSLEQVEVEGAACFLAVVYDITERKQAEQILTEQAIQLSDQAALLDLTHETVIVRDMNNAIIFWNRGAEEMYGWTQAEALGQNTHSFLKTRFPGSQDDVQAELLWAGRWDGELIHTTRDGRKIVVVSRQVIQLDEHHQSKAILEINTDITERKQAEEALAQEQYLLNTLLENAPDHIYFKDTESRFLRVSKAHSKLFGLNDPAEVIGKTDFDFFTEEHARAAYEDEQEIIRTGQPITKEEKETWPDRPDTWVIATKMPLRNQQGEIIGTFGISKDITQRKRAEEALHETNETLIQESAELDQRNHEIALLNELGNLLQTCNSLEEADTIIGQLAPKLFPGTPGALYMMNAAGAQLEAVSAWGMLPAQEHAFPPQDCRALERKRPHFVAANHSKSRCPHVSVTSCASVCIPLIAQHGEVIGVFHLERPQTSFVATEQELVKAVADTIALALTNLKLRETLRIQSIRDPLTGLYNRRFMEESLERELRRATRSKLPLGMIMLDLDHFKHFNDTFSHAAGDTLLRELGKFLETNIRAGDVACRYGGEEFLLLLPEASLEITKLRAEKLCNEVRDMQVQHRGILLGKITLSLGVAVFPDHGLEAEDVLRAADAALYRAKRAGRNQVAVARRTSKKLKR